MQTSRRKAADANRAMGLMGLSSLAVAGPVLAQSEPELMLPNAVIAISVWLFAMPLMIGLGRQATKLQPCRLLPRKVCAVVTGLLR